MPPPHEAGQSYLGQLVTSMPDPDPEEDPGSMRRSGKKSTSSAEMGEASTPGPQTPLGATPIGAEGLVSPKTLKVMKTRMDGEGTVAHI